jgi:hypothetical protein
MVSNMRPLPTPLSCVWPYQVDSVLETGESRTRAYSIEVYPRPIPLVSDGLRLKPQARRPFFVSALLVQKIRVFFEPRPKIVQIPTLN